eukprot:2263123-Amphidinium_carterae.3
MLRWFLHQYTPQPLQDCSAFSTCISATPIHDVRIVVEAMRLSYPYSAQLGNCKGGRLFEEMPHHAVNTLGNFAK